MSTWQLRIVPRPGERLMSMNDHMDPLEKARRNAYWRGLAASAAKQADLPKGILRARVDALLTFADSVPRDSANYHQTLKPVIDGLGSRATYHGRRKAHPAYGLFIDDDSAHLDGPHITIGPPLPTLRNRNVHGFITLDITELED